MDSPEIVVIRGAMGVGKSTLLRHLRGQFPKSVAVEMDYLISFCTSPQWDNWSLPATRVAARLVNGYLMEGQRPVFVVYPMGNELVKELERLTQRRLATVTLWAREPVLKRRIQTRGREFAGSAEDTNRYFAAPEHRLDEELWYDTSSTDPMSLAERISRDLTRNSNGQYHQRAV